MVIIFIVNFVFKLTSAGIATINKFKVNKS